MITILQSLLDSLRAGNVLPVYEHKDYINDVALRLYEKPQLTPEDQEDLKTIILISNICYNDTDRDLLPIEDGFYDVLLEKYKKYDKKFQVGAEVIKFEGSRQQNKVYVEPTFKNAVIFDDPDTFKDNQFFKNSFAIDRTQYIDHRDVERVGVPLNEDAISKRYHDTAHNHPELVGTLDKAKFVLDRDASARGVLNDMNVLTVERDFFGAHLRKGIITPEQKFTIVLELKYDGISVEADCTDEVVSARSRGDTGMDKASDFTPFLKGYKFPHREPGSPMVGVKFEAIMTEPDLAMFNMMRGQNYKNCRTAMVALQASNDAWKYRDLITLVPLAVEQDVFVNECHSSRIHEIEYLNRNFVSKGCPLRYSIASGNYLENLVNVDIFTQEAESMRSYIPFMYDGVVLSYEDPVIREKLGRENFINKYSIAVKFNPMTKQTIFRGYTYTVGQDGSITPMIHYDPIEFYGTIHTKSTGHSYARFQELDLRIGDMLSVEYVNDVMPYVSKPFNQFNIDNKATSPAIPFPTVCPVCGKPIEVSESGKSARCTNPDCGGRQLTRMVATCAKLGMVGFGEATISQIGVYHLKDLGEILNGPHTAFILVNGKGFGLIETENMRGEMYELLHRPILDTQLLGAIGFTSVSTKTWETILRKIPYETIQNTLLSCDETAIKNLVEQLKSIKGIGPSTVDTIVDEFYYFDEDILWMYEHGNIVKYVPLTGKKIRATGFRDKEYFEYLRWLGFDADDNASLTKDTDILLVPTAGHTSAKTQKAASYGVLIVPISEFRGNESNYT